jgi:hypothetical protein
MLDVLEQTDLELAHNAIDKLARKMINEWEETDCPLTHIFTPGLYTRQIIMPAFSPSKINGEPLNTWVISKVHKTQHPFNVSKGMIGVYNVKDNFLGVIEAPYIGITMPGTRRVLRILTDCVFTTSHPLKFITGEENNWDEQSKAELLQKIEYILIERRDVN